MANLDNIPTLETIQNFNKDAKVHTEIVTSGAEKTNQLDSAGKSHYTLAHLNQMFGGVNVGDYVNGTVLTKVWEYAYNPLTGYGYKVKSKSSLPYAINTSLYPDPEDDPNLKRVSDVNHEDVTKAQEELLGGGTQIYPRSGYLADGMTVTVGTTHLRVLVDGEPVLHKLVSNDWIKTISDSIATNINTSTPPWSVDLDGNTTYLISYPYSMHEFRGYGVKTGTSTEQDAINNRNAMNACISMHPNGGTVYGHQGDTYEVIFDEHVRFNPAVHVTIDGIIIDLRGSKIKMRDNDSPEYRTVFFDGVSDCKIINGKVEGDKLGHTIPPSTGTHEFGFGVSCRNVRNFVADRCESYHCTGDSYHFYFNRDSWYQTHRVDNGTIQAGGIDPLTGDLDLLLEGYYTDYYDITPITEDKFHFWPRQWKRSYRNADTICRTFFYNGSTFLSYRDTNFWENEIVVSDDLPTGTTQIRIHILYIEASAPSNAILEMGGGWLSSENVRVENCEIHSSRRQGITFGGCRNARVVGGSIHDISGTAPQSGIDIEEGINSNISVDSTRFYNNEADFQSPSGLFVTLRNVRFGETPNDNSYSSETGSVTMYDCQIDNQRFYLNGRVKLENCKISNSTMSGADDTDGSGTKTFENCMFKNVSGTGFPSFEDNYIVVDNCTLYDSLIGEQFTVHRNCTIFNSSKIPNGRYFDCTIYFDNSGAFTAIAGELHNTKVIQNNAATENLNWSFLPGYKIKNCNLSFDAGAYQSKITFGDGCEILDSTIEVDAKVSYSSPAINLSGDANLRNSEFRHLGTWTASNTAIVDITNSGNVDIKYCSFNSDSEGTFPGVYIRGGTPVVKVVNSDFEGCVAPTTGFTTAGNVDI